MNLECIQKIFPFFGCSAFSSYSLPLSKRVRLKDIISKKLTETQHHKVLLWLGHFTFLVLGLFSWFFYKERMLHFDSANYAYHLIYFQHFYTGHGRLISILPQLLPLFAAKAGMSLEMILRLYSLSFILLYYLLYWVVVHGFRNLQGGLFMSLSLILTVRYKFYAPVGEVVISIAFIGLLVGLLTSDWYASLIRDGIRTKFIKIGLAILLSSLFVIIHPFAMVTFSIVWLIWMVYSGRWKIKLEYFLPFSWVLIWGAKFLFSGGGTSYESGRLDRLNEAQLVLLHLKDYYVWDRFIWYLNAHYTLPLVMFVATLVYLFYQKKWWTGLIAILSWCFLAAVVITLHSYLNGPIYVMLDGYMAHLGVVMALVFVLPFGKSRNIWIVLLFILLVIFSLDRIRGVHEYYSGREYLLLNIIKGNSTPDEPKLLAHMDAFDYDRLWLPWAVGIETHLMTSLERPDQPQTLYFQNYGQTFERLEQDSTAFLSIQYAPDTFQVKDFPPQLVLPKGIYKELDLRGRY